MLISETRFTTRSYFKIPNTTSWHSTPWWHRTSRNCNTHQKWYQTLPPWAPQHGTSPSNQCTVEDSAGPLTIAAIYCPPKHTIKAEQFRHFYATLQNRFLAGGDYNAKHTHWGSRLITPRGRELLKAVQEENLMHVSTGEPTYWPSDGLRCHEADTRALNTSWGWLWSVRGTLTSSYNHIYEN
jgi:hypothetical protein